jgi:hypothetical protein
VLIHIHPPRAGANVVPGVQIPDSHDGDVTQTDGGAST